MSKFNYQTASTTEIATHFLLISRQAIWLVKQYYKNDDSTLKKILQAEKEAKITLKRQSLERKLEELSK